MNEQDFIRDITRTLDTGVRDLDASTTARLASARRHALSDGHTHAGSGILVQAHRHPLLGVAMAIALAVAGWLLLNLQQPADTGEADILLLTDELPPNAYAEQEFSKWLSKPDTCPSPSSC